MSDDVEGEIDAGEAAFGIEAAESDVGAFDDFELDEIDDDEVDGFEASDDADRAVAKDRHPSVPPRRASWERPTRIAVGSLALIAIMFLFVFPTRSYLAQQRQVGAARDAVHELRVQNKELERRKQQLQTPSEIERLAREQFNMVLPNEQAYNVLSTATTTTTSP